MSSSQLQQSELNSQTSTASTSNSQSQSQSQDQRNSLSSSSSSSSSPNTPDTSAASAEVSLSIEAQHLRPNTPTGSCREYSSPLWNQVCRLVNHPLSAQNTHVCRHQSTPGGSFCNKLISSTKRKKPSKKNGAVESGSTSKGSWQIGPISAHFLSTHQDSSTAKPSVDRQKQRSRENQASLLAKHSQVDGSSPRSGTLEGAKDELLNSQVHMHIYGSHSLPDTHITQDESRELIASAVHYGAIAAGASSQAAAAIVTSAPKLSIARFKLGIEAEHSLLRLHVQVFIEEKYCESGGNCFGQLQSDGGQFANHEKFLGIGFQATSLDFGGKNLMITLGVPLSRDGHSEPIASLITETIEDLCAMKPKQIAKVHVADCAPNAQAIARYIGLIST
jgi:hypothetical protein